MTYNWVNFKYGNNNNNVVVIATICWCCCCCCCYEFQMSSEKPLLRFLLLFIKQNVCCSRFIIFTNIFAFSFELISCFYSPKSIFYIEFFPKKKKNLDKPSFKHYLFTLIYVCVCIKVSKWMLVSVLLIIQIVAYLLTALYGGS